MALRTRCHQGCRGPMPCLLTNVRSLLAGAVFAVPRAKALLFVCDMGVAAAGFAFWRRPRLTPQRTLPAGDVIYVSESQRSPNGVRERAGAAAAALSTTRNAKRSRKQCRERRDAAKTCRVCPPFLPVYYYYHFLRLKASV